MEAFAGDDPADCLVVVYSDADFAGDTNTCKSTSGCYLVIIGTHTFLLITAISKQQMCVSHSSTESEIVALDTGLRKEGIPVLALWDVVIDTLIAAASKSGGPRKGTRASPPTPVVGSTRSTWTDIVNARPWVPDPRLRTKLVIAEDNDAVIRYC